MADVLRTSWAVARSGWLATWNRSFRFSRMKGALIFLLLQLGFFVLIARRAPMMSDPNAASQSLSGMFTLMAIQMGWFGLMYGFVRGQDQLYQGLLVPLFQITPARPLAFLVGRVIEAVPTRAWSCLLWAWVYSRVIPGNARWGAALLLAAFGLLVGVAAHLSGLLMLTFWSTYSPRTMRNGTFIFGTVTLALGTWAVIFLAEGGSLTALSETMRHYRPIVMGAVVAIGGVPGLLLLAATAIRPAAVESLYRQGVYKVIELNEADITRPNRSVWLPIRDHVLRPILSREWLELARSRVTRVQFMIWLAGTVGVIVAGRAMAGEPFTRVIQYVGGLALFVWFLSFGHWVVRVFEKERRTVILYRLAAIPTPRLLLAKFTSVFVPSMLLVTASTVAGAVSAGLGLGDTLSVVGWALFALVAGTFGGFGLSAATADQAPDDEVPEAAPRRDTGGGAQAVGSPWWALLRTFGLIGTAALPVWTGAGQPGLPWKLPLALLMGLNLLVPLALLVLGITLMVRTWDRTGA